MSKGRGVEHSKMYNEKNIFLDPFLIFVWK